MWCRRCDWSGAFVGVLVGALALHALLAAAQYEVSGQSTAANGQARLHLPSTLPTAPEQYMDFLVCKGFCNQLQAFLDGVGLAYLLNLTLVLPRWYKTYNFDDAPTRFGQTTAAQYDSMADQAVPMAYFWDTDFLAKHLQGTVRIVTELPAYLRGDPGGTYTAPVAVDPSDPRSLAHYQAALQTQRVLRLLCTINTVRWSDLALGSLRAKVMAGLRPSARVATAMAQRINAINALLQPYGAAMVAGGYIGMHLRNERDWYDYCQLEPRQSERTWVDSFEHCYYGADRAGKALAEALGSAPAEARQVLYVATGNLTHADAQQLLRDGNFSAVANEEVVCLRALDGTAVCSSSPSPIAEQRELRAAIDMQLLIGSRFFIGNEFSSFSFTVRTTKLVRRDPLATPSDAIYYNSRQPSMALDITKIESRRFQIIPGALRADMYTKNASRVVQLLRHFENGNCVHMFKWGPECELGASTATAATNGSATFEAAGVSLGGVGGTSSWDGTGGGGAVAGSATVNSLSITVIMPRDGEIEVGGRVDSRPAAFYHTVTVYTDNRPRAKVVASRPRRDVPLGVSNFLVHIPVGVPTGLTRVVILHVCVGEGSSMNCTGKQTVHVPSSQKRYMTRADTAQQVAPVIYAHLSPPPPGVFTPGGGRMSMHQLHAEINKLFEQKEIAVRSILYGGNEAYKMKSCNYSAAALEPSLLTPRDYILSPERRAHLPNWHRTVVPRSGVLTMVFFLGQHGTSLHNLLNTDGYKHLCRDHWLGFLYRCAPKAYLIPPMSPEIYTEAEQYRRLSPKPPKEDLVLVDPDNTYTLDTTRIQLPPGGRLVFLDGFSRSEVLDLYSRAKVYIDSYLTGIERQIMESALFGVVPVVAHHGNGLDARDFPLPPAWRWRHGNYTQLNELVTQGMTNHSAVTRQFRPLRYATRALVANFSGQVRRYLQDDVHVMIPAHGRGGINSMEASATSVLTLLFAMANYPFSTQEVLAGNAHYWAFDLASLMQALHRQLGLSEGLTTSPLAAELRRFAPTTSVYLQRPRARHFRQYQLLVPAGVLPVHPALARAMFRTAFRGGAQVVVGPGGVLLVQHAPYYSAVDRLLPYLPEDAGLEHLLEGLRQLNVQVRDLEPAEWQGDDAEVKGGCATAVLRMYQPLPEAARCICPHLKVLMTSQPLAISLLHVPPVFDQAHAWLRNITLACA